MKSAIQSLEQEINKAQQRLDTLSRAYGGPPADAVHLLPQALEELSNALEELRVSANELETRNEELLLARGAVERERRRYLELFELAPDAYLVTDAVGTIVEANHAAARLFRRHQHFLIGKPLAVFVAPAGHAGLYDALHDLQRGTIDRIHDREIHLLLHDGAAMDISITASTVRDHSGQISGIRWLMRDITERKHTDQRLAGALQEIEHIMATVPDVIYTLDTETRLLRWNAKLETATGLSPRELGGRLATSFFPQQQHAVIGAAIERAFVTGYAQVEADLLGRGGSPIPYSWTAAPLKDAEGRIIGLTGIGHDISERKQADRAMAQLSSRLIKLQDEERRRLGRELHDSTAQNLAGLAMNLSLVNQSRPRLPSAARRALDESLLLVDQSLLEIRTISYLLHPPLLDEVGLASAVRWYAEGFAQRSGIQVDLAIMPQLGRLPEDMETALFRVVQESLTNVHRHADSPTVHIHIAHEPGTVTLEISDEGKGLAAAAAAAAAADSISLIGVGIMGMRERMRQLGGELTLIPRHPGLTVRAILPKLA